MEKFLKLLISPLYTSFAFKMKKINDFYHLDSQTFNELSNTLNVKHINIKNIYCDKCQTEMSFSVSGGVSFARRISGQGSFNDININHYVVIEDSSSRDVEVENRIYKVELNKRNFFDIMLTCNHNQDHLYIFSFEIDIEGDYLNINKIGQWPEPYILDNYENYGFKKQLKKLKIENDFKNIHVMMSNGYFVCSLMYLRRTLEKIVNYPLPEKFDRNSDFGDKIKYIKDNTNYLSPKIIDVTKMLHKLSSISIHNLEDDECREFVEPIYNFIIIQLTYMKYIDEEKDKINSGKSLLNRFLSQDK
ncbi:MAG: hypothetical protein K9L64_05435 [Candidatus Izimaplasma sp.]|nr:hypothetical protein [Candidatus Izimaplasma bacterium]